MKGMDTRDFNKQKSNSIDRNLARYARPVATLLIVAVFISSSLLLRVEAAAGDLDLTFGNGGKVVTDWGGESGAHDVGIQADGKIVVVGGSSQDFAIARYTPDGMLDSSFGSGGKALTDFEPYWAFAQAVAIQANGKIVVGGVRGIHIDTQSTNHFALARYNTDGSLDTTFGSGGIVVTAFSDNDTILDLAIQSDGRIIAVGWTVINFNHVNDLAVLRYHANGSVDTSFGSGGIVAMDFFGNFDGAFSVVVQPDGDILVAGATDTNPTPLSSNENHDFLLLRFNANGSLDTAFGTGGKVITDFFGKNDVARSLALQPDGRILLGGGANNGSFSSFALARYNANGSPDTAFGNNGKQFANFIPLISSDGFDMTLLPNGKIVMVGKNEVSDNVDFMLARFSADGSLDSLGSGNYVLTDFSGDYDSPGALTLYGNDQIIAIGSTRIGTYDFALARYLGDEAPTAANLSVMMSTSLSTNFITYTITVSNYGPDPSYYLTLKDTIPANTTFQSLSVPSGWVVFSKPAVGQSGTISVSKSKMADPHPPFTSTATFTLVVRVNAGMHNTMITNRAAVTSSFTADPYPNNNKAISQTYVP
jgi:uncharacterized delta-60 repeat protein/uncharacterized repeat protein (TIGR01451 family)